MIFTSYFAKLQKLPDNMFPVAICRSVPDWYSGATYNKLAPPWGLVKEWKSDPRNDDYFGIKRRQYDAAVLDHLGAHEVMTELEELIPDEVRQKMKAPIWETSRYNIVLLCYEKPSDFCHRHFVAQWLQKNGYDCEELWWPYT